ncbi:MAG: hypothetical protein LAO31_16950 [Acidobacteriia bacterium]|nr:hypothetical protein [Terriglobia bacterium]
MVAVGKRPSTLGAAPKRTHLRIFISAAHAPSPLPPRSLEVFLLTSRHTFSAGEGFCYHMENLKRATVIGEPTGGGANPGVRRRLDNHFWMFLPTMRALSPTTGTNWNGVGV